MADTLEELRKHVEDVIRRLSEAEAPTEAPPRGRASDATLAELEKHINLLGSKVERASNMLAQVTDLLESQTERIETLEQHLEGSPTEDAHFAAPREAWVEPAPGPPSRERWPTERQLGPITEDRPDRQTGPAPHDSRHAADHEDRREARETQDDRLVDAVNNLLESVRVEVGALGTELRERVRGLEAHVAEIFGRFGELRDLAWQHRGELRDLEERLLILADTQHQTDGRETPVAPASDGDLAQERVVARPPAPVFSAASEGSVGPAASQPALGGSALSAAGATAGGSPLDEIAEAPMDARTVRRLEELVEREVRLQQDFAPGAPGPATGPKGRISVMVVDDLPDARKILSIYLSRTGYHVVTASSAEDCLAKLRHHEVDALVVDASMPGGGGAQVCRTVREDPAFAAKRDLPIIVYTAYPDQYPPELVRQWKATDYVVKGGDMLPLITALVRHTRGGLEARP